MQRRVRPLLELSAGGFRALFRLPFRRKIEQRFEMVRGD
jgi:hypothetical protein